MIKICYTALCGGYDDPKPVLKPTPGWRYIFFTDDKKLKVDGWEMHYLDSNHSPKLKAKLPKILPDSYLPHHNISLWIDASYQVVGNLDMLCKPFEEDREIGLTLHTAGRIDVYQEADTILKYGFDSYENVQKALEKYTPETANYQGRFYQAGVIFRKNTERVKEFNHTWYVEMMDSSLRDQLTLPLALNKHQLSVYKMAQMQVDVTLRWSAHKKEINNIFFIQPYGFQLKIGDRLNYEIGLMPEDAWIVLTDQDTCFLIDKVGDLLNKTISRYPDTALFGAYTNRLGLSYQKWDEVDPDNFDMLYHHKIAEEKLKKYYSTCSPVNKPIAGFFMMFPKKTWHDVKFQSDIINKNKVIDGKRGVYFDYDFSYNVLKQGGKVMIMKGLYIYHHYRVNKNIKDVKHLTSII